MCERLSCLTRLDAVETHFLIKANDVIKAWKADVNISSGQQTLVLTSDAPKQLRYMRFGFTPHWADRRMDIIHARAEGDSNKENDPSYNRAKGIIRKLMFRKAIRTQRCLVLVNGYILGNYTTTVLKHYFLYPEDRLPIMLAGIWESWQDPTTKEMSGPYYHCCQYTNSKNRTTSCAHHYSQG